MSLIITSSSQETYDDLSKGEGLCQPQNYQNQFRSPLIIAPNSEIAVASVKCQRDGMSLSEDRTYAVYWGTPPGSGWGTDAERAGIPQVSDISTLDGGLDSEARDPENVDVNITSQEAFGCSPNRPLFITLPKGQYSKEEFEDMLQVRTARVVRETYEHVASVKVELQVTANDGDPNDDLEAGVWKGYIWTFKQDDGNSSGTDEPQMDWTPYIDAETLRVDSRNMEEFDDIDTDTQDYAEFFYTDKFDVTNTAGHSKVKKKDSTAFTTKGTHCEAIGTGLPLGLSGGTATFDISACGGGFCVGLVRNLVTQFQSPTTQFTKVDAPNQFDDDSGDIRNFPGLGTMTYYDYAVQWVEGHGLEVFHTNSQESWGGPAGRRGLYTKPSSLTPTTVVTNASLQAQFYDKITFTVEGEKMKVSIYETASGTERVLIAWGGANGAVFKPVGMTNNMLFPKIYIQDNNDEIDLIDWWHSDVNGSTSPGEVHSYWTQRYLGCSLYNQVERSKQREYDSRGESKARALAHAIDSSKIFQTKTGDTVTHTHVGVNASGGVDYYWSLHTSPSDFFAIPWSSSVGQRLVGTNAVLGLQAGSYRQVNGEFPVDSDGNTVKFWSQVEPETDMLGCMYVRVSSTAHNTYNGCTESISKILWGIPKQDNSGNVWGPLYFEPHERLYVDLEYNEGNQVINNIQIQIVDITEEEVKDLVGNTVVMLHIRQKGTQNTKKVPVYLRN